VLLFSAFICETLSCTVFWFRGPILDRPCAALLKIWKDTGLLQNRWSMVSGNSVNADLSRCQWSDPQSERFTDAGYGRCRRKHAFNFWSDGFGYKQWKSTIYSLHTYDLYILGLNLERLAFYREMALSDDYYGWIGSA
jgi:hypothetical protein